MGQYISALVNKIQTNTAVNVPELDRYVININEDDDYYCYVLRYCIGM